MNPDGEDLDALARALMVLEQSNAAPNGDDFYVLPVNPEFWALWRKRDRYGMFWCAQYYPGDHYFAKARVHRTPDGLRVELTEWGQKVARAREQPPIQ